MSQIRDSHLMPPFVLWIVRTAFLVFCQVWSITQGLQCREICTLILSGGVFRSPLSSFSSILLLLQDYTRTQRHIFEFFSLYFRAITDRSFTIPKAPLPSATPSNLSLFPLSDQLDIHTTQTKQRRGKCRVVLVGGGHSHVQILRYLALDRGSPRTVSLDIILISKSELSPYSGMLPGYVAGKYSLEECHVNVKDLCDISHSTFILDEVMGVNHETKDVYLASSERISFDILSINVGCVPSKIPFSRDGISCSSDQIDTVCAVKPIDSFVGKWNQLLESVQKNNFTTLEQGKLRVVVVGGGAGGVEIILAMYVRLKKELPSESFECLDFHIISRANSLLSSKNDRVKTLIRDELRRRNIQVSTSCEVSEVQNEEKILRTSTGQEIPFSFCLFCTQASAPGWIRESTELRVDQDGFVVVNNTLTSISHPNSVLAVGDCCSMEQYSCLPKAGVYAVRMGPILYENVLQMAEWFVQDSDIEIHTQLVEYTPQRSALALISLSNGDCVASKGLMAFSGKFCAEMKDLIDRQWMNLFKIQ